MRVAMYYNNNDVRLEELPMPEIQKGELLIRVMAGGICGSDVMEWYRKDKAPLVLGHEIAGQIVEVGEGVADFKKGDHVVASHHVPCGDCFYCRQGHPTVCETIRTTHFDPGGFSEFLRLPAINVAKGGVYKIAEGMTYEEATFIEPLACVLHGQRQARFKPEQSVLVLGCGISGILHIQVSKTMGARCVVGADLVPSRLEMAQRLGADAGLKAGRDVVTEFMKQNGGRKADLVVVCTGAVSAMKQALEAIDRAGSVLFFAPTHEDVSIPLPLNEVFWRNETLLTTSYAASPADHLDAMDLIKTGQVNVKPMITHRFGLQEAVKGFQLVAQAGDSMKVILEPQK